MGLNACRREAISTLAANSPHSALNLVLPSLALPTPNWPMSAEWFWLTLLHSPLPLTEGSHNSQCCRNIILSFSLSLSLSLSLAFLPPFRVYSAIVSRTGDQSANSHMNADVRLAAGRGPTGNGYLFQTTIVARKRWGSKQKRRSANFVRPIRQGNNSVALWIFATSSECLNGALGTVCL